MSMELSDEILGIGKSNQGNVLFEWNSSELRPDRSPRGVPFEVNCRQGSTKTMGDSECGGCPNLYRGICVMNNQEKIIKTAVVPVYGNEIRALLCDLVFQILKGMPYIELKNYLLSKYTHDFLAELIDPLAKWLKVPGLLGMLIIDTEWFDGCSATAKKIKGLPFSPSCVKEKTACDACEFRRIDRCGLLNNSRILRAGDTITTQEVNRHINELLAKKHISQTVAKECQTIAEKSPIAGLARAVKAARDPRYLVSESNLIQDLHNLGDTVEDKNLLLFANEPEESKEIKQMLWGSEMKVEIDPPPQFEKINYVQTLQKTAGIDEFLSMDKT